MWLNGVALNKKWTRISCGKRILGPTLCEEQVGAGARNTLETKAKTSLGKLEKKIFNITSHYLANNFSELP